MKEMQELKMKMIKQFDKVIPIKEVAIVKPVVKEDLN